MSTNVDLYDSAYGNVSSDVLSEIRRETYGEDLGQSSWLTVEEYDRFCASLQIDANNAVLETASGSGGPALYIAQKFDCSVTGIDINQEGINAANEKAASKGLTNARFQIADVSERLPFADKSFTAIMCIDAANHFPDRQHVLNEWSRILKPGGRLLFTDPVVITGPVTNQELADRSSIGVFVFIPPEITERMVASAGLKLLNCDDVTENVALTSGRWFDAREKRRDAVIAIEGQERFDGLQRFLAAVHMLTTERRLSRFAFLAEK
jgi:SAM-dependent methyltransferase